MKPHYNKEKVEGLFEAAHSYLHQAKGSSSDDKSNVHFEEWNTKLSEANTADLIALITRLDTRDVNTSRETKALRESVISQINFNNALQIAQTMERLDKTATILTIVSVALTLVGTGIAVWQLFG